MQVKNDIINLLRKKQKKINNSIDSIIDKIEKNFNIEDVSSIENWMYEFLIAIKFIEKKTIGFPKSYENSIILDSILKDNLSNEELQKKVMPFIISYMQILKMVQSSSSTGNSSSSVISSPSSSSSSSSVSSSERSE